VSDPVDPLAASIDPDIPTPTQEDLIRLVNRSHQEDVRHGTGDARLIKTLLASARRQWDEGHKRKAERQRAEQARSKRAGGDVWYSDDPNDVSLLTGQRKKFIALHIPADKSSDKKQEQTELPLSTGTRVPGQTANESDYERRQRERKQIESEVVDTMHPSHREKYENPNTPEHWRRAIFQTYKDKMDESQRRADAQFQERLGKIVEAQDWLQRIKDDPARAHLPRPADDSEEALLEWHGEMSKPRGRPDYGNPPDVQPQRKSPDLSLPLDDTLQKPKDHSLEVADDLGGATREAVGKPGSEMDVPTPDKWLPQYEGYSPTARNEIEVVKRPAGVEVKGMPSVPVINIFHAYKTGSALGEKLSKLAESNFFMGGGVGMVIAAYAFLLGGAPRFGFALLILSWLVISISLWRHRFFENRSRENIWNIILCGLIGLLLLGIWILLV
jgi:hypothetical protein